jgi:hypothetical protein
MIADLNERLQTLILTKNELNNYQGIKKEFTKTKRFFI